MRRERFITIARVFVLAFLAMVIAWPAAAQEEEEPEIWIPENLTSELRVKAAYNGEDMLWLFEWQTFDGGNLFHDVLVYQDGEWTRRGDSGGGADPDGLREDRLIIMLEAGAVPGFANQGCATTCHGPLDSMSTAVDEDAVLAALGEEWGESDIRKYIPASRAGDTWWDAPWDKPLTPDELLALREAGVFVDMWHWRSGRSNAIGYADDQYVLEYRNSDEGRGPYGTNWNSDASQPNVMFNPDVTGFYALNWDKLMAGEYTQNDIYFIDGDNTVEFDPDHEWQNGDVIPRRLLRTPEGSRATVTADGRLADGVWQLELRRAMVTGALDDHDLVEGRVYNASFAVHMNATGARWHHISMPLKVGIGVGSDITAVRFSGNNPDWNSIPWTVLPIYYPGEISWDWLTSDGHPGALEMRADERSCASCHGSNADSVLKLAQASVAHETGGTGYSVNWWLTLAAGLTLLVGGSVTALNFSKGKEK